MGPMKMAATKTAMPTALKPMRMAKRQVTTIGVLLNVMVKAADGVAAVAADGASAAMIRSQALLLAISPMYRRMLG